MTTPKRIQLSRRKGWRKPENTVVVARPSRWGNPWKVGGAITAVDVVQAFTIHLSARRDPHPGWVDYLHYPSDQQIRRELAGKNLACWCPLDQPCHADVLLEIANGGAR